MFDWLLYAHPLATNVCQNPCKLWAKLLFAIEGKRNTGNFNFKVHSDSGHVSECLCVDDHLCCVCRCHGGGQHCAWPNWALCFELDRTTEPHTHRWLHGAYNTRSLSYRHCAVSHFFVLSFDTWQALMPNVYRHAPLWDPSSHLPTLQLSDVCHLGENSQKSVSERERGVRVKRVLR